MMSRNIDRCRTILRGQGFFVLIGRILDMVQFFFHNTQFRMRILHGYYVKNRIECKANKELLERARANFGQNSSQKPLVSVIIPTYNRAKTLTERTIPSVLRQTCQNFELIIVGDQCTDNTEELVKKFYDRRIRFLNLQKGGKYPRNPLHRWLVAGSIPRNKGLEIARGEWIAPLDDDDEFSEDHLEVLLKHAVKTGCELVYGVAQMEIEPGRWVNVGSYPLELAHVCHLSVMYSSKLRFFKYDINAWKYLEPDDWNLFRRMKEAGVKIGFVDRVIGKHYLERTSRE